MLSLSGGRLLRACGAGSSRLALSASKLHFSSQLNVFDETKSNYNNKQSHRSYQNWRRQYHSSSSRWRWQKSFVLGGHDSIPETPPGQPRDTFKYIARLRGVLYASLILFGGTAIIALLNGREEVVPFIGRKRFAILKPEQERALGDALAENLLEQHKNAILPDNHPAVVQLSQVVNLMCEKNGLGSRKLVIIADGTPNAFVMGGKYIFFFTGLSVPLKTVDEAAFVIGHEIGHTLAGHWGEGMVRTGVAALIALFLGVLGGNASVTAEVMRMLLVLPKSRKMEKEADIIGLHLMSNICCDPDAALKTCDALGLLSAEGSGGITSTHPHWDERKQNLIDWMASDRFQHFLALNANHCPRRKRDLKLYPMPIPTGKPGAAEPKQVVVQYR